MGDPVNAVKIFNEKFADELLLLDYTASAENRLIDFKKIAEIAGEAFMPMAYGGGIKTFDEAKKVFEAGFEKVVLNTSLFSSLSIVGEIASVYGAQSVVASIDAKRGLFGGYRVFNRSGARISIKDPAAWAKKLEDAGVGEIIINVVDKDGTWTGYELSLLTDVAQAVNVPVVACGGAASIDDFRDAIKAGASAVAAGSMFVFQKKGMGVLINFPADQLKM